MTFPEAPTVAITGASGFLGARAVKLFREKGFHVLPVARSGAGDWKQVDDYSQTPAADILLHLAEDADRGRVNEMGKFYEEKVQATFTTLLAKRYHKVVYASSAAVYGDSQDSPRKVSELVEGKDAYARAKLANERQALIHGGSVLRFSNLYGSGMSRANAVSAILRQIPGEGDLVLWDGTPIRDFLWIDDAAAALLSAATAEKSGLFNVGTGTGSSIHHLATTALSLAGGSHRGIRCTHHPARLSTLVLDIGETTRRLGWKPVTSVEDGIGCLINRPADPL